MRVATPPVLRKFGLVVGGVLLLLGGWEWWRGSPDAMSPPDRDYYRVADETGRRLWLFREGLYPSSHEIGPHELGSQKLGSQKLGAQKLGSHEPRGGSPQPRWFIHGLFA